MNILIVEDETKTGDYVGQGLPESGLVTDLATNVIEVALRRLRAKVDDPFEPKLIRTVRGMGYVMEAPDCP